MSKNKIAVIGIGNTLRRDDGIGIRILELLLNYHKRKDIDYLNFSIASFDLIHRLQDYKKVLLIDGIDARLSCAELKIFSLDRIEDELKSSISSSHELNLKDFFKIYKELGIKTEIYVAGIQVKDTSFGEGLSEELKDKQNDILKQIKTFIENKLVK